MSTAQIGGGGPSAGQLRRARPEQLRDVARRLRRLGQHTDAVTRGLQASRPAAWQGGAGDRAGLRHDHLRGGGMLLGRQLSQAADILLRAADDVLAAQQSLAHAEQWARRHGLVVDEGGEVRPSPQRPSSAGEGAALASGSAGDPVARAVESAVRDALHRYAATARLLATVAGLEVGAGVTVRGRPGEVAPVPEPERPAPVPPLVGDPVTSAGWFAALDRSDQERVVAWWPEWAGAADGLPGWARDRANRSLLAGLLAGARVALDQAADDVRRHAGEPGPAAVTRAVALARARARLADLNAIDEVAGALPARGRQVLALDAGGARVCAAVSTGDIDTAGHLAVFVPGFRTSLASHLAGYDARNAAAADLGTRLAREHGDGRPVVVITWHGYPAPQTGEVLDPDRSVLSDDPARDGAARLAGLLAGLHAGDVTARRSAQPPAAGPAAATAPPRRVVLWGHSYGSLVCGIALRDHRPPVDALVAFGSPGLGVRHPSDLCLPARRIYVAEAAGDAVADAAAFGADPGSLPGVVHVATGRSRLPDGTTGAPSIGHEGYLSPGSTSAWGLAAIAAGADHLVRTTGVCHAVDVLRPCG